MPISSVDSTSIIAFSESQILFELAHLEGELSDNLNCFMFDYFWYIAMLNKIWTLNYIKPLKCQGEN